jgi:orotidine-5'-phosphate decarboxylase
MLDDALDRILARAARNKCDHFVLPAHDVTKIKRWSKWIASNVASPLVLLTGFGALGGSIETSFAAAAACKRRFAIVGRLITGNQAPGDAAARMYEEMQVVKPAA